MWRQRATPGIYPTNTDFVWAVGRQAVRQEYASKNELAAWAGESFASLYNAQRAADAFKAGSKTARYDIYPDTAGAWRWRAWRGTDKVAALGESFSSRYTAERAGSSVRDNGGGANGMAA